MHTHTEDREYKNNNEKVPHDLREAAANHELI